ncbi:38964_t:CDS:2 [Gigaspora margarita]|uniref:Cofilin n=1 Tax=Gigaspora margarita TaxID=4874 RepID=A0ABN7W289_GIGMA|nr:38964_t:CDS:2 [Gigaspora margarita]
MFLNVLVPDVCVNVFTDLKLYKKYKYILYKFSNDRTNFVVDVAELTESDSNNCKEYYKFYTELTCKKVPYFAVYDFDYEKPGEGYRNKIIFISWVSEKADVQDKMISATSKEVLKTKLDISFQIEGTIANDIEFKQVLNKVLSIK